MSVKTYDPKQVIITIGGAILSGFADGAFVSLERDEDLFTKVVGADGETSRAKSNNRSGSLTLTLQDTSGGNDILSGFAVADELTGTGVVPILIKDLSGRTVLFAAQGWVKKMASVEFSKENSTREWVLDLANVDMFVGGHQSCR